MKNNGDIKPGEPKWITMLRMLRVAESSPAGYSEAVEKAVEKLLDDGEKVHFFKLNEARGSVRDGEIEYQVVLEVAVE